MPAAVTRLAGSGLKLWGGDLSGALIIASQETHDYIAAAQRENPTPGSPYARDPDGLPALALGAGTQRLYLAGQTIEIVQQMHLSGDWVVPRIAGGEITADKLSKFMDAGVAEIGGGLLHRRAVYVASPNMERERLIGIALVLSAVFLRGRAAGDWIEGLLLTGWIVFAALFAWMSGLDAASSVLIMTRLLGAAAAAVVRALGATRSRRQPDAQRRDA